MAIEYKMAPKFAEIADVTGATFYYVKYTTEGKRKQKRLHNVPCTCKPSKEYCEHKIRALQAFEMFASAYGELANDQDQSKPIPALMDEYIAYSKENKIHKPKTLVMVKEHLVRFLNFCRINDYFRVASLNDKTMKEYIAYLSSLTYEKGKETRKYSDTTININLRNVSTLLNYAVAMQYMTENPLSNIGKLKNQKLIKKPQQKQKNILTDDEIKKLLSVLTGQWHNVFILFLYSGLRLSELVNLTWSKVGVKTFTIEDNEDIEFSIKGHTARELPIVPPIAKAFEWQREHQAKNRIKTDFVFCTRSGKPLSVHNVYRWFKITIKKHEIKGIYNTPLSPHSLRHTFCTRLLDTGLNVNKVKTLMGHKDIETTLGYARNIGSAEDYVSKIFQEDKE